MSDQSFQSGDPAKDAQTQQSFQDQGGDNGTGNANQLTPEQLAEIVKRDEHAQAHIRNLESEAKERNTQLESLNQRLQELTEQVNKQETFEEALRKLKEQQQQQPQGGDQSTVDADQIAEVVRQKLEQESLLRTAEQNKAAAIARAQEKYGENFLQEVQKTAESLGMSLEKVDQLAAETPEVFNRLFLGETKDVKRDTGVRPQNHRAAEQHNDNSTTQRQLYRENKRNYWSSENYARVAEQIKTTK